MVAGATRELAGDELAKGSWSAAAAPLCSPLEPRPAGAGAYSHSSESTRCEETNVEDINDSNIQSMLASLYPISVPQWPKEVDVSLYHTHKSNRGDGSFAALFVNPSTGRLHSCWNDIPCRAGEGVYYFVNEVPRGSTAKMEMIKEMSNNPIMQDRLSSGTPRHYFEPIQLNYGFIPQTLEAEHHGASEYGALLRQLGVGDLQGDGDPIDVLLVDDVDLPTGAVIRIKILGGLLLIDKNEIDWKIVGVSESHPRCEEWCARDLWQVAELREKLEKIMHFFRVYKTYEGKPENKFGNGDLPVDRRCAEMIVEHCHASWRLDASPRRGSRHA